jgi:chloramphenicol O-acetyltransferase
MIWKKKKKQEVTLDDILNGLWDNSDLFHAMHKSSTETFHQLVTEAQEALRDATESHKKMLAAIGEIQIIKTKAQEATAHIDKQLGGKANEPGKSQ